MFEPLFNNEERGQVGIGTLIVFIAMVLVAAIAAGVLINTAGFLQTQAEATGEESTEQVSNNLQVESVVSEVEGGEIRAIAIDLSLAPGSNPIDITSATLEFIGASSSGTYAITSGDPSTAADINSANGVLADSSNFDTTLSDKSNTARIYLVADADGSTAIQALGVGVSTADTVSTDIGNHLPLSGGAEADITITSPSGGQTTATVRVPDVLVNGEGVRL
jgi:flagellin FlaB